MAVLIFALPNARIALFGIYLAFGFLDGIVTIGIVHQTLLIKLYGRLLSLVGDI